MKGIMPLGKVDGSFRGFSDASGGPQNRTMFMGDQDSSNKIEGRRVDCEPPKVLSQKRTAPPTELTKITDFKKNKTKSDSFGIKNVHQKASNLSASFIKIGDWQRVPRYEPDLIAKCYFAKQMLVWEILEDEQKRKIEFHWSVISAIKVTFEPEKPDVLEIELKEQPLFFKETGPEPKRHTLWNSSHDFTDGQASRYRRHCLKFCEGTFSKHYEKFLQDKELCMLLQRPFPSQSSPYFEPSPDAMPGFPSECKKRSESLPVFDQPYENLYQSQHHHTGVPRTIETFELASLGAETSTPLIEPTIGAVVMNSPFSAIGFPQSEEHVAHAIVQRPPFSVDYFQPVDCNGAMNQGLHTTTPFCGRGIQNPRSAELGYQAQEMPFGAYTTPVPNFLPRRLTGSGSLNANKWSLNANEEFFMNDPNTYLHAGDLRPVTEINSTKSLFNTSSSQDLQLRNRLFDEEQNYDNGANTWTGIKQCKQSNIRGVLKPSR